MILYCRVSTEDQGQQYSLAAQERALRDEAARAGEDVVAVFTDQSSGKDLNRPEFQKMMAVAKSRAADAVRVWALDRLSRNAMDALAVKGILEGYGVELKMTNLPMEIKTPAGEFSYGVMALVAQLDRKTILARTRLGMMQKVSSGGFPGGRTPFGYRYFGKDKGVKEGRMEIEPRESKIVQRIFREHGDGQSLREIARGLRRDGISTSRGGLWRPSTLRWILANTIYIGQMTYAKGQETATIIPCPRIIDDATFYKARTQANSNREMLRGRPSRKYLFRSMLRCRSCGKRVGGEATPGGGREYRCSGARGHEMDRSCSQSGVKALTIERSVMAKLWGILTSADALSKLLEDSHAKPKVDDRAQRLERLWKQERRYVELLEDPDLELAKIKDKLAIVRAERFALEAQGGVMVMPSSTALKGIAQEFRATHVPDPEADYDVCRELLEDLRIRIVIENKRFMAISGEFDPQKYCPQMVGKLNNTFPIPFSFSVVAA